MSTLLELITEHCADLRHDYPAIADRLNARTTVENPNLQGDVLKPVTLLGLMAAITPQEALSLIERAGFVDLTRSAVENGDREGLTALLGMLAVNSLISAPSQAAIAALLSATEPDPQWTATLPGPSLATAAGLGRVTASQVQGAMNT